METRICSKCSIEKELTKFYHDKKGKNNFSSQCKICRDELNATYRQAHKEQFRTYAKNYAASHKEQVRGYKAKYEKAHKEEKKRYRQNKLKTDISYKLSVALRRRTGMAVKGNQKSGSAVKDLGCSIEEFKKHLESKFYPNPKTGEPMTWDNWTIDGWHLDHIVPLSLFNLSNREEFLRASNYTNYQPLWADDNLSKSNKINWQPNDQPL